jgi:hypothetical protein
MTSGWRIEVFGTVEGLQQRSLGDLPEVQETLSVGPEWEDRRLSSDVPVAFVKTVPNYKGLGRLVWLGLYWSAQEKGVTRPGGYVGAGLWTLDRSFDIRQAISTLVELKDYAARQSMVDNRFVRDLPNPDDFPEPVAFGKLSSSFREVKRDGATWGVFSDTEKDTCPVLFANPLVDTDLPMFEWVVSDTACRLYKRIVIGRQENVGALQISGFAMDYRPDRERFLMDQIDILAVKLKNAKWQLLDVGEKLKNQEEDERKFRGKIQDLEIRLQHEKNERQKQAETIQNLESLISRLSQKKPSPDLQEANDKSEGDSPDSIRYYLGGLLVICVIVMGVFVGNLTYEWLDKKGYLPRSSAPRAEATGSQPREDPVEQPKGPAGTGPGASATDELQRQ